MPIPQRVVDDEGERHCNVCNVANAFAQAPCRTTTVPPPCACPAQYFCETTKPLLRCASSLVLLPTNRTPVDPSSQESFRGVRAPGAWAADRCVNPSNRPHHT